MPAKLPPVWFKSFSIVGRPTPSRAKGRHASPEIVQRNGGTGCAAVQFRDRGIKRGLGLGIARDEVLPVVVKTKSEPSMRGRPVRNDRTQGTIGT